MKITYIDQPPPGRPAHTLDFGVSGDALVVTHRTYKKDGTIATETRDTFDFTGLPDGQADVSAIETTLPFQPLRAAERTNGALAITLLRWVQKGG